jgi:hypothetical protein
MVARADIMKDGSILVVEHSRSFQFTENQGMDQVADNQGNDNTAGFYSSRTKFYGDTALTILEFHLE